jgi:signal transduction histidine kinase
MSVQASSAVAQAPTPNQERRLSGAWLIVARAIWLALACVTLSVFVVSLPAALAQLTVVCATAPCANGQLPPADVRMLTNLSLSLGFYAAYRVALDIVFALIYGLVAALLFWRKSAELFALLVALALLTFGMATFPLSVDVLAAAQPVWQAPVIVLHVVGLVCFSLFLYLFPDGRFVPRWTPWVALPWIAWQLVQSWLPSWPRAFASWATWLDVAVWLGALGTAVYVQVHRYRRVSNTVQRQQIKWVVFGIAMALTGYLGVHLALLGSESALSPEGLFAIHLAAVGLRYVAMLLIPLAIGIAILRYRLWDIDILINRTLVFGTLTACVVGIYVLVIGSLSLLFETSGNLPISLVATGLVAVLFQPLRERLQRGVNRLLYGARDEPYAVLANLGQRLENAHDPEAVLPTIAETVRDALKLPYAAIILDQDGRATFAASAGSPVANPLSLPLFYQGEVLGQLILGPRGRGETFDTTDRRLIAVLARQVGVAAHAVRLTAALQRSREQLVLAREEERRRLRNDLHDGIGPQLASLTLKIQTARLRLAHDPLADTLLAELVARTQATVADIRRVVYDLRPPSLDELGLLSALRESAAQYQAQGLSDMQIHVDAPEQLAPLPAAVEVAVYRVAQEALTNVLKHAQAHTCWLRLAVDAAAGVLCLEVQDDGQGIAPAHRVGVGLRSMRERAVELGGTLTVESGAAGGTQVRARLPLKS